MRKKTSIPVSNMAGDFDPGVNIEKICVKDLHLLNAETLDHFEEEANQSHRHDRHSFFLLEAGTVHIEIDFQKYIMRPPSVIYIHPDQVHRTLVLKNVTVSSLAINNEKLNPEYLKLLEDITPAKPLVLQKETFIVISEAIALCIKFSERRNDKLYHSLLKDSCNALVALIVSQYLKKSKATDNLSRLEKRPGGVCPKIKYFHILPE